MINAFCFSVDEIIADKFFASSLDEEGPIITEYNEDFLIILISCLLPECISLIFATKSSALFF
tara:strand:- start:272 stop:460 length:189 start_codon:yes stop_codon:yes gene_type:complete